jgi:Xaa-Pro aminopeptidase
MNVPQFIAADLLRLAGDPPRDASPLVHALRMLKSPAEIERVRRAVASAAAGYQAALEAAKPGMTEKELVSIIASTMYATGSTAGTKPVFVNSVSGRERYPLVDTPASDRRIAAGDVVFIDGGAASDGYVSDILRLIGTGPLRAEDRRFAEVAAAATATMVCAARPGARVSSLLRAASAVVAEAGVTTPVGVVGGHGIGLELWERPLIKEHADPDEDVTLRPGMVLCLEPILAPPHPDGGLAGIFVFEQQVLVTEADDPDRTDGLVFRYTAPALSRNGVTGRPSEATVELGARLWDRSVRAIADRVERGRTEEPPLGAAPVPGFPF